MRPKRLVLSGGGIRVTAFIGALEVIEEHGYLKGIEEFVGVSAGSWLGFMLAIGYTIKEMKEIIHGLDFNVIRNLDPDLENYGMDNGENLEKLMSSLLRVKGIGPEIKFRELSKGLRIYASDLNLCKIREFSKKLTPDVSIIHAIRASCAIPLYFTPIKDCITGNYLSDGGVINNYPIVHLTNKEIDESIGLAFIYKREKKEIGNLMDFMSQLLYTALSRSNYKEYLHRTIFIGKGDYPAWNFEASLEDKRMLIEAGRDAAAEFFSGKKWFLAKRIVRRNSL